MVKEASRNACLILETQVVPNDCVLDIASLDKRQTLPLVWIRSKDFCFQLEKLSVRHSV